MLPARLLLLPSLAALSLLGASAPAGGPEAAITRAAAAPFQDVLRHDGAGLCAAFVPAVAARLVHGAAPGVGCEAAVSHDFALTAANEPSTEAGSSFDPTVRNIEVAGQHATVKLSFTFVTTVAGKPGTTKVGIHSEGSIKLELEETGGAWLVSSQATLGTVPGCLLPKPRSCRPGARVLLFFAGEIEPVQTGEELPTPAAVKRAGGAEQREFEAGKLAFAQSGCLACHRLADHGNAGPGPNLTHIGSKLSEAQIVRAVDDPRAPMPSFRNLPAKRLRDLVRFLALLR
jgi:hypothetical protein